MGDRADGCNARERRRTFLTRSFARASAVHPLGPLSRPTLVSSMCSAGACGRGVGPAYRFAAPSPFEANPAHKPSAITAAVSKPLHHQVPVSSSSGGKSYSLPYKGLFSALYARALTLTIVKCYALSFGSVVYAADAENENLTDERIQSAHRAGMELTMREVATTSLRRLLEKLAILFLSPRWASKLLKVCPRHAVSKALSPRRAPKEFWGNALLTRRFVHATPTDPQDVAASARRKASRFGRLGAAPRMFLTTLRSSVLVHIATWAVEAAIDVLQYLRGQIRAGTCGRLVLHRTINRLICFVAGGSGAAVCTLVAPGMGTFVGALLAESAAPYLTIALFGDAHSFAASM